MTESDDSASISDYVKAIPKTLFYLAAFVVVLTTNIVGLVAVVLGVGYVIATVLAFVVVLIPAAVVIAPILFVLYVVNMWAQELSEADIGEDRESNSITQEL